MSVTTEQKLWVVMRNSLKDRWFGQRLEDRLSVGVPDVIYSTHGGGAIELKVVKNVTDKLRVTTYQRAWLKKYGENGGKSFLLVWCQSGVLALFDWETAYRIHNIEDSKKDAVMWCELDHPRDCMEQLLVMIQ